MSFTLLIWTSLAALIALVGISDIRRLFHYPIAASMLMLVFMVPQGIKVEEKRWFLPAETDFAWLYICACLIFLTLGFYTGQRRTGKAAVVQHFESLSLPRLQNAALFLTASGAVFYWLMLREVETGNYGSQWTGVIALYALLTSLLVFGLSISWLLYLKTRSRAMLFSVVFGLVIYSPVILYDAKRFPFFILTSILFLGLYFVRGYKPNRLLILTGCMVGALLINKAGDYRRALKDTDSNVATLIYKDITESETFKSDDPDSGRDSSSAEIHSYVSDINLASYYNIITTYEAYRNTLVQLYVPAFILGKEYKNSLKTAGEETILEDAFPTFGQTRTGFSDSFVAFGFFGVFVFFAIAYLLGWIWRRAEDGDSLYQFLYITLLPESLVGITESTARFLGVLPFVFGIFFVLSRYVAVKSRPALVPKFAGN